MELERGKPVATEPLRLIIIEDEHLLRDLLHTTLSAVDGVIVAGTYAAGQPAYREMDRTQPHVALLDIDLGPGWTGVETGLRMRDKQPDLGIVLLSNHASWDVIETLPEAYLGGWSYLLKKSVRNLPTLVRAIRGARDHLMVLDPLVVERALNRKNTPLRDLSSRQVDILSLVSQGYTNAAIAKTLFLSEKSIENQLTAIYAALSINSGNPREHARVKAVLAFLAHSAP